MSHPVSGCVLCYNEERCIESAIECLLHYCDEVFVLDSGSEDDSMKFIKSFEREMWPVKHETIRQVMRDRYGYKQGFRMDHCLNAVAHDWVLILDADEVLDEIEPDYFRNLETAVRMPRLNLLDTERIILAIKDESGKWIDWWPDAQIRFVNRVQWHYDVNHYRHAVPWPNEPATTSEMLPVNIWHLHSLVHPGRQWATDPNAPEIKTRPLDKPLPKWAKLIKPL
jgi:glycosyltransferase involved in cell wall biosynthesis